MENTINQKVSSFFQQWKREQYKKGELLIRAGDDPSGGLFLESGLVKEYAIAATGEEVVINIFKPRAFFPMTWVLNDTHNRYFFEALDDVVVYKAPKEKVKIFLNENPDVVYDLLQRILKGTEGLLLRMAYLMAASAYARLITELVIHAKRFGAGQSPIRVPLSEKELAAQTGMARETVSREMKQLKEKKLITLQGRDIIIHDLSVLEAEVVGDI